MNTRRNSTAVIVMIVMATLLFAPVAPIKAAMVQAQQQQDELSLAELRRLSPDDPRYYNDDRVRYLARNSRKSTRVDFTYLVGSSPQIRGGARTEPLEDEEDVPNDRVRDIETMSRNGTLAITRLPLTTPDRDENGNILYDDNGNQIMVPVIIRQKKLTKKLLMIKWPCSNWAREVGFEPELQPAPTPEPCVDLEVPVERTVTRTNSEGKTEYGTEKDYKCRKETVWETVKKEKEPCDCIPGSYTPLLNRIGNQLLDETQSSLVTLKELKKAKEFSTKEVAVQIQAAIERKFGPQKGLDVLAQMNAQKPGVSLMELLSLHVGIDPCELGKGNFRLLFEGVVANKHGRSFWGKFKWFFIIAGIVVVGAVIIRSTRSKPRDLIKITPDRPRTSPQG